MPAYFKKDVLKALEIEKAISDKMGNALRSPDPNWPGNLPAGSYEQSLARVKVLQDIFDETDDGEEGIDGGSF